MANLAAAGFRGFKLSVVMTRHNIPQLDAFRQIADEHGAQLRLTRLRPSGRGADVWPDLHPTRTQQRELYDWLVAHGEQVLTGDSFFHLSPYGPPLPGLNLCGAGRVVCLIDPVGDVYACPFAIHENFLAGSVRQPGGFEAVWRTSPLFADLRQPQTGGACQSCGSFDSCRGGCMAAKFFTGLPLDGPDPECVQGHGEAALAAAGGSAGPRRRPARPPTIRTAGSAVTIGRRPPVRACDENPLAGSSRWARGQTGRLAPATQYCPGRWGGNPLRVRGQAPRPSWSRPDSVSARIPGSRLLAGGTVLAGGSPARVLRLTPSRRPARGRLVVRYARPGRPPGPRAGPPPARHRDRAARRRPGRPGGFAGSG